MVSGSESGLSTLSLEGSSGHSPRRMLWSTVGACCGFRAIRRFNKRSRQNGLRLAIRQPVWRTVPPEGPLPSMASTASMMVSTGATVWARSTSIEQKSPVF